MDGKAERRARCAKDAALADRRGRASALNNLLASPTFAAWCTGATRDVAVLDGSDARAMGESVRPPSLEPASGGLDSRPE